MQIRVKLNNLRFFRFVAVVVFLFTINSLLMLTWDVCTIWMSAKRRYKRYRVGKHANQLTLTSTSTNMIMMMMMMMRKKGKGFSLNQSIVAFDIATATKTHNFNQSWTQHKWTCMNCSWFEADNRHMIHIHVRLRFNGFKNALIFFFFPSAHFCYISFVLHIFFFFLFAIFFFCSAMKVILIWFSYNIRPVPFLFSLSLSHAISSQNVAALLFTLNNLINVLAQQHLCCLIHHISNCSDKWIICGKCENEQLIETKCHCF